ncbi:TIGR03792 family protein [Botrimarina sp.]|uniref:TIGR03792 family protein n=1 Tax=Botrimarina sp. TaxID=2795802 RepID=UPI0032EEA0DF
MSSRLGEAAAAIYLCVALSGLAVGEDRHVVEELTFRVAPEARDAFLQNDAAIWTPVLAQQPGYLGKETWLASDPRDEVKLVIRWRRRADWNAVPEVLLAETDRRFRLAMGDADYEMTRGRAFLRVGAGGDTDGVPVESLLTRDALLRCAVVAVESDPVYHGKKSYLAVPLRDAVAALVEKNGDPAQLDVVFDCVDGYNARMPLGQFLAGGAWLAFRDADASPGEAWVKTARGPAPEKMGRAYVVWPDAKAPGELTWPYAVERIRIEPRDRGRP